MRDPTPPDRAYLFYIPSKDPAKETAEQLRSQLAYLKSFASQIKEKWNQASHVEVLEGVFSISCVIDCDDHERVAQEIATVFSLTCTKNVDNEFVENASSKEKP